MVKRSVEDVERITESLTELSRHIDDDKVNLLVDVIQQMRVALTQKKKVDLTERTKMQYVHIRHIENIRKLLADPDKEPASYRELHFLIGQEIRNLVFAIYKLEANGLIPPTAATSYRDAIEMAIVGDNYDFYKTLRHLEAILKQVELIYIE